MFSPKNIVGINQNSMNEEINKLQQISSDLKDVTVKNPGLRQMAFGSASCATAFPGLHADAMFGTRNLSSFSSQIALHYNTQSKGACANAMVSLNAQLCGIAYDLSGLVQKTAEFLQNTSEKYENVDTDLAAKMNHS